MYLYILNGNKEGESLTLSSGVFKIGRSTDADIVINDDQYISGIHAELHVMADGKIYLSDAKSRNGTYLLGESVNDGKEVSPGDIFRTGHTFFKLSRRAEMRVFHADDDAVGVSPEAVVVVDIVGSSSIAQAVGDRMASKVKSLLFRTLKICLVKHPPEYLKSTGDGFMIIFPNVKPAVYAAMEFLGELKQKDISRGIHVRIGINYGETTRLKDGDRRGMAVDMAFRVEGVKVDSMHQTVIGIKKDDMPRADRIFITEVVQQMVASDRKVRTRCIGFFDLKGFTGRHKLFEVIL